MVKSELKENQEIKGSETYKQLDIEGRLKLLAEPPENRENFPAIDQQIEKFDEAHMDTVTKPQTEKFRKAGMPEKEVEQQHANHKQWLAEQKTNLEMNLTNCLTRALEFMENNRFLARPTDKTIDRLTGRENALGDLNSVKGADVLEQIQQASEGLVIGDIRKGLEGGDMRAAKMALIYAISGLEVNMHRLYGIRGKKEEESAVADISEARDPGRFEAKRERSHDMNELSERARYLSAIKKQYEDLLFSISQLTGDKRSFDDHAKLTKEISPDYEERSKEAIIQIIDGAKPKG
ncbi:MAG: hypothetical protein WC711_03215 [Candidatus Staskawiczbacteria bacterium]|jgi:hypothetical protein